MSSENTARFTFAPAVQAVLKSDTPEAQLAGAWVRYAQSLVGEGGVRMEDAVANDVRCSELEAAGYPAGLTGLRLFRSHVNEAFPDERVFVASMRFPEPGIVAAELHARATHLGPLMGRQPTGKQVFFVINTLNRFVDGRLKERWDRVDFGRVLRELE